MRFFTPLIAAGMASMALAAPANLTQEYSLANGDVPTEAIIAGLVIPEDATPFVMDTNGTSSLVFLNTTILESVQSNVPEVAKRDANADAKFHWIRLKWGQPIFKRSAEADAEADAGFHWIRLKWGQPIFKREADAEASADAEADAGFHWIRLKWGQPIFKRSAEADAEADAGFHWIRLKWGQPIF